MRFHPRSAPGAVALAALLGVASLATAFAQQDYGNPPGRAAQLSYIRGSVSLEPAGTQDWTAASLNRPLTNGDRIWADKDSRVEIDIGDAVVRLGSMTGFSFLNLDQSTAQMQVTAGTAIVHVRSLGSGETDEIDTPNLALSLEQPGTYRVDVSQSGDTTVVEVLDGQALATGGGQSYPVNAQQAVTFMGTSELTADYETLGVPDSFDDWSMARDRQEEQAAQVTQPYVAPQMVGSDQLSQYGTWQYTPSWGYAWFPAAVAPGWAPYSYGNWIWVSPWGWTWDDDEPWGFAPFHYGRWGYWHDSWCWIPGPRYDRPIYAPALVGWVGGRDWGGGRRPDVGWFPLGPRDVYVPPYHVSPTYVQQVNITNTRIVNTRVINNIYEGRAPNVHFENSVVPGAITAVPRGVFTSAQPVRPHRLSLPRTVLTRFHPSAVAPAIVPARASVLGARTGRIVRPPRALMDRPVVARVAPPRGPVPFGREVAAIRANGGRPLPVTELARLRPAVPASPVRLAGAQVAVPSGSRPGLGRPGVDYRGAPGFQRAAPPASIGARERALQHPALPPAGTFRGRLPPGVQQRPYSPPAYAPGTPAGRVPPLRAPDRSAPPRSMPQDSRPPFREAPPAPRSAPRPPAAPHPRAEPRGRPPQAFFGTGDVRAAPVFSTQSSIRWDNPPVRTTRTASAEPAYRPPVYQAPTYRAPAYRAPAPVYRAPVYRAPAYHAPMYRAPAYHPPVFHSPPPMYRPVPARSFQARPAPMPRAAPPQRFVRAHPGGTPR